MAMFIKASIRLGRNHFCSPVMKPNISLFSYYFDPDKLTRGQLPTGRGCRICGKIGHKVKDCDQKRVRQKRPNAPMAARTIRDRTCNNCGSPNHLIRECPEIMMDRNRVNHNGYRQDGFTQRSNYVNSRQFGNGRFETRH